LENLRFFAGLQGIPRREANRRTQELLAFFGLSEKRNTVANLLSQGMKQKLAIACALIKGTPLLLLDEPTLGLDVEASHEVRALIRELAYKERKTIVLSSHDMRVVEDTCGRVIILSRGRVVADDSIPNLLSLFRTRAFRINFQNGLSDKALARLSAHFPTLRWLPKERPLEVELSPHQSLYELIDLLREAGTEPEGVHRVEPDLEEVFLLIFAGAKYAQGFGINLFGESLEGLVLVFWCGPLLFLPIPIFPGPLCGRPSRGRWNSSTCARSVFVS